MLSLGRHTCPGDGTYVDCPAANYVLNNVCTPCASDGVVLDGGGGAVDAAGANVAQGAEVFVLADML